MTRTIRTALLALALALYAGSSPAQDRGDTGRTKAPRPKPKPQPVVREDRAPAATTGWTLGFGGGLVGGGSLFRVQTVSGAAVPWGPDDRAIFISERFRGRLDTNLGLEAFATRRLGERWALRADLGYARLDVAAEALQGQSAGVFLFDRLTLATLGLGCEGRLTSAPSYPLVTAGVVLVSASASRESELDQTALGARLGLGAHFAMPGRVSLRVEARLTRLGLSTADLQPDVARDAEPEIILESEESVNLFDIMVKLTLPL